MKKKKVTLFEFSGSFRAGPDNKIADYSWINFKISHCESKHIFVWLIP